MLDFLNKFLAPLLAKFKAANPTVFAVIAVILMAMKGAIDAGLIPIDPKISTWILFVVALFTGTQTHQFIKGNEGDITLK